MGYYKQLYTQLEEDGKKYNLTIDEVLYQIKALEDALHVSTDEAVKLWYKAYKE